MSLVDLTVGYWTRILLICVSSLIATKQSAAQEFSSTSSEAESCVEERFLVNAVRSTSLQTPGAAIVIPLEQTENVRGTILDVDGSPAANAEVWAASLNVVPGARERAYTDEKGNYELHLGQSNDWWLTAYKGNTGADIGHAAIGPFGLNHLNRPAPIKLAGRCSLLISLSSASTGAAVPGACVYLDDGRVLASDVQGHVTIGGLAEGSHFAVIRSAENSVAQIEFHCVKDRENRLDISLAKAHLAYGQIMDAQGEAIPNAWLSRHGSRSNSLANDGTYSLADGRGRFAGPDASDAKESVFSDLLFNTMSIWRAGASGFQSKSMALPRSKNGQPIKTCIILPNQSALQPKVNVVAPIQGGLTPLGYYAESITSADYLAAIPAGAMPPDLPSVFVQSGYGAAAPATIASASGLISRTDPRRVVDIKGRPISGVRVEPAITRALFPTGYSSRITTLLGQVTDENGIFNCEDQAVSNSVIFSHEAYADLLLSNDDLKKTSKDIILKPKRRVNGRVVDESGNAVRSFQVSVECLKPKILNAVAFAYTPPTIIRSQYSDSHGRFQFTDTTSSDGRYRVTVSAKGLLSSVRELVMNDEESHGQGDEFLFTLKPRRTISLKISSAMSSRDHEIPVEHATVAIIEQRPETVFRSEEIWQSQGTYPGDVFEVDADARIHVEEPSGQIAIQAPGYARHFFYWNATESEYVVKLVPEAEINVAIVNTWDAVYPEVELQLSGIDDTNFMMRNTVTNSYKCGNLASGWYQVALKHGPYLLTKKNVLMKAGETTNLQIHMNYQGGISTIANQQVNTQVPHDTIFSVNGHHPANPTLGDFADAIRQHGAQYPDFGLASMTDDQLREALKQHLGELKQTKPNDNYAISVGHILQEMIDGKSWPRSAAFSLLSNSSSTSTFRFRFPTPDSEVEDYECVLSVFTEAPSAKK